MRTGKFARFGFIEIMWGNTSNMLPVIKCDKLLILLERYPCYLCYPLSILIHMCAHTRTHAHSALWKIRVTTGDTGNVVDFIVIFMFVDG